MVKEGIPFVAAPAAIALLLVILTIMLGLSPFVWLAAGVFILVALFMVFFFRDPARTVPADEDAVVSAADGKVMRIEETEDGKFVSVFLSPLNVHINRAPIAGKISAVKYIEGRKIPATNNNASLVNERNSLFIDGAKISVVCTQIAGIMARRIVCWRKAGDSVKLGEKFGLIKFSSRTDLLMPSNVEVLVGIGDKVVAGETIIARIKSA